MITASYSHRHSGDTFQKQNQNKYHNRAFVRMKGLVFGWEVQGSMRVAPIVQRTTFWVGTSKTETQLWVYKGSRRTEVPQKKSIKIAGKSTTAEVSASNISAQLGSAVDRPDFGKGSKICLFNSRQLYAGPLFDKFSVLEPPIASILRTNSSILELRRFILFTWKIILFMVLKPWKL